MKDRLYMKKILSLIAIATSMVATAQTNLFLDQSFWKTNPDVATVKAAMEKGNDATQLNAGSFDPVVYAINNGTANETIYYLLGLKGNDVNKITHDGRTYIFWAAYKGNTDLMEFLLKKGAKTDLTDSHGSTIANFAAGSGQANTKVYDICIAHGADLKKDLNNDGANALLLSVASDKNLVLTNYFLSKGLDIRSVDRNGNTAFNYAVRSGNKDLLNKLIEKGVKYNDNAMIMATQSGRGTNTNTVSFYQYLESLQINPAAIGKNGENALHYIVRKPNQQAEIDYFLSKGVEINKADLEGNTVFMNAASSNKDVDLLKSLLTQVKDINAVNKKGITALALAIKNNSPDVVSFLISSGASVEIKDAAGDNLAAYLIQSYTPTAADDFEKKLNILLSAGLDMGARQGKGNTLYHLALAKDNLALLKKVASFNIDVNAKNAEGLTVLHKAAMTAKNDGILKYLLSVGASKTIETNLKETVFDLATENEYLRDNHIAVDFLK